MGQDSLKSSIFDLEHNERKNKCFEFIIMASWKVKFVKVNFNVIPGEKMS